MERLFIDVWLQELLRLLTSTHRDTVLSVNLAYAQLIGNTRARVQENACETL